MAITNNGLIQQVQIPPVIDEIPLTKETWVEGVAATILTIAVIITAALRRRGKQTL